MKILLPIADQHFVVDLSRPTSIALPFTAQATAANAWYAPPTQIEPVRMGDWVGSVAAGASVNFNNVHLNPHANGCHTESLGHISPQNESVFALLQEYHFVAALVSVPTRSQADGDQVITAEDIAAALAAVRRTHPAGQSIKDFPALVLRTLPNLPDKTSHQYSHTNPPYLTSAAMHYLANELNIAHLLIDLPSVDKEEDGGALAAHRIFWGYPDSPRPHNTITEFIYVPDALLDGFYFLQLGVAPLHNDATPSNPCLYTIQK